MKNLKRGRQLDELSPFRRFFQSARRRGMDVDITLEHMKEVWDGQDGVCPLTGIKMILPAAGNGSPDPYQASIDRIDNAKGYVVGNVRFICVIANYARSRWDDTTVIEFCRKVATLHDGQGIAVHP